MTHDLSLPVRRQDPRRQTRMNSTSFGATEPPSGLAEDLCQISVCRYRNPNRAMTVRASGRYFWVVQQNRLAPVDARSETGREAISSTVSDGYCKGFSTRLLHLPGVRLWPTK